MKLYHKILIIILLTFTSLHGGESKKNYGLIFLKGAINPVVAEYTVKAIEKSNEAGYQFILIEMDTPGGMVDSMRTIIKAIMSSSIPVIVYTSPQGAQAASAGGFIMISAHVAAMAPGTEIGAMHPVSPMLNFGQKDKKGAPNGVMEKKVLNDTVAYARSLAQKRKRNQKWAVKAVKEAVSATYKEALKLNIIDLVAENRGDLLTKLNGWKVLVHGKVKVLQTSGVSPHEFVMDWKNSFLNKLADPQLVMILLVIAVVGIGIEFKAPGMIVPGVIGSISLVLFLVASKILPINVVGVVLLLLAIVLFILEVNITSYGLLTVGGIISFIAGPLLLFDGNIQGSGVPIHTIGSTLVVIIAFMFIVVRSVVKAHRLQVVTGSEGMVGERAVALKSFTGKGTVRVHGEIWTAVTEDLLDKDEEVEVVAVDGMTVTVKKQIR
jgi:membrane-bound serine protease (ClpP class)